MDRRTSLKALGANSIDRADIIMMTLETLALNIPLHEMAKAENIGDLAGMLQGDNQRVQQANPRAGGMLDSILDRDGDGQVDGEDLAGLGMSVLGGLFGKR